MGPKMHHTGEEGRSRQKKVGQNDHTRYVRLMHDTTPNITLASSVHAAVSSATNRASQQEGRKKSAEWEGKGSMSTEPERSRMEGARARDKY